MLSDENQITSTAKTQWSFYYISLSAMKSTLVKTVFTRIKCMWQKNRKLVLPSPTGVMLDDKMATVLKSIPKTCNGEFKIYLEDERTDISRFFFVFCMLKILWTIFCFVDLYWRGKFQTYRWCLPRTWYSLALVRGNERNNGCLQCERKATE